MYFLQREVMIIYIEVVFGKSLTLKVSFDGIVITLKTVDAVLELKDFFSLCSVSSVKGHVLVLQTSEIEIESVKSNDACVGAESVKDDVNVGCENAAWSADAAGVLP